LHTIAVFVFYGVLLIVENTVKTFVQMRNVVAAIEIVVDEHLPIAGNVILP